MHLRLRFAALSLLVLASEGFGQPSVIRLRSRVIEPTQAELTVHDSGQASPRHLLIHFDKPIEPETRMRLANRGVRIHGAIPDNALLVTAPAGETFEGLGVDWQGPLSASDKLAAEVAAAPQRNAEPKWLVFEFFQDSDPALARQLLGNAGIEIRDHPDLKPWQLLGLALPDLALQIAADDSVAFVFPASEDLVNGAPSHACYSTLTAIDSLAAPLSAAIGNGWGGPGRSAAALTYSWGPLTNKLAAGTVRAEILRAMAEWSRHAKISFSETSHRTAARNIDILFGSREHGDHIPFDGPGRVLAHTFYPSPPNSEPIAGDMHFDADEPWNTSMDLFSVALHELGHALGLGHSTDPASVMYPFYRRATALAASDIQSILQLYAPQDSQPVSPSTPLSITFHPAPPAHTNASSVALAGTVTGGQDPIAVSWTTEAGVLGAARGTRDWSIPLIPLAVGTNRITVTASGAQDARVSRVVAIERRASATPPDIEFTEPGPGTSLQVTTPQVRVRGTATHSSGIDSVTWRNSRTGSTGLAAGTGVWDTGTFSLQPGANEIVIDARARDGSQGARSVVLTLAQQPQQNTPDTTPPRLTILSPSATSVTTTADRISILGSASDNIAVTSVTWSTPTTSGSAIGASNWSASVPLLLGMNNITIRAFDAAGNSSWRAVTVTRR